MSAFCTWLAIFVALFGFASCGKSTARFKPGDTVIEKNDRSKKGIVYLRFNTNTPYYYLKVPGKPEKSPDIIDWFDDGDKDNLLVHIEGPFGDEDLELAQH